MRSALLKLCCEKEFPRTRTQTFRAHRGNSQYGANASQSGRNSTPIMEGGTQSFAYPVEYRKVHSCYGTARAARERIRRLYGECRRGGFVCKHPLCWNIRRHTKKKDKF